MIYFVVAIMSSIFMLFYEYSLADTLLISKQKMLFPKAVGQMGLIFSFLILFIPQAIRYGIGIDFITYSENQIPNVLANNNFGSQLEIGYQYLIRFGYFLGKNQSYPYQVIFALTSFVIIAFVVKSIVDQSYMPALSTSLFLFGSFYNYSMSGMRQSIAIAIWLYSLKYVEKRQFWRYLLCIIIAFLFHRTAIIFLLFYFIKKIPLNFPITVASTAVVFILSSVIRTQLMHLVNLFGHYSNYFGGQYDNGLFSRYVLIFISSVTIFAVFNRFLTTRDERKYTDIEMKIQYVLFILQGLATVLPTPNRTYYLFLPIAILLIPNTLSFINNKFYKMLAIIVEGLFFVIFFGYIIFVIKTYGTYPYVSIFN